MIDQDYPLRSLREGHWFKLICGASFQHLPAVRNLALAYTLAGADCVDVAADPAVVFAAKEAFKVALNIGKSHCLRGSATFKKPLLMVSFNDGEDPHFRKAEFLVCNCPSECTRPCEAICPADAIVFQPTSVATKNSLLNSKSISEPSFSGVIADRCYGCGRCLPICPVQNISTRSYVSTPHAIAPLILQTGIDAIEIHTQVGRLADFQRLWSAIVPWADQLKLIAISCPDGNDLIDYLWALHDTISPISYPLIWQTDGRPMSGDIGIGATRAAIKLGQKVLASGLPGYVQLAGGTNHHTVPKLRTLGLLKPDMSEQPAHLEASDQLHPASSRSAFPYIAGVAYGSYARSLLSPILAELEAMEVSQDAMTSPRSRGLVITPQQSGELEMPSTQSLSYKMDSPSVQELTAEIAQTTWLETSPHLLWQAVNLAHSLVSQLKPAHAMPLFPNSSEPSICSN